MGETSAERKARIAALRAEAQVRVCGVPGSGLQGCGVCGLCQESLGLLDTDVYSAGEEPSLVL
jgi:hypothetical protein